MLGLLPLNKSYLGLIIEVKLANVIIMQLFFVFVYFMEILFVNVNELSNFQIIFNSFRINIAGSVFRIYSRKIKSNMLFFSIRCNVF